MLHPWHCALRFNMGRRVIAPTCQANVRACSDHSSHAVVQCEYGQANALTGSFHVTLH